MKLRTYSSNLNKGTVTILPQRNSFWKSKDYLSGSQTTVQFPPYSEDIWRAVSFYVVNKCSFSGLTESSSFSKQASDQNFSLAGIERLRDYQKLIGNWKITNLSYEQLLSDESRPSLTLIPHMKLDLIYMANGGICIAGSTTTILLSSVIGLLVLNLYLITRLNSFVRGLKNTKQQSSHTPTP